MKNQNIMIGALATVAVACSVAPTVAQEEAPEAIAEVDLRSLDCRSLLRLGGDERQNVVLFLHGYVSGAKQQNVINLSELAAATDGVVEDCIDNPSQNLLSTFQKARG